MKKYTLFSIVILGIAFLLSWSGSAIDVNGTLINSVRAKNQKGSFRWKVCQESTYVDSAGTPSTTGTWIKDNTGFVCLPASKSNGMNPIQLTTVAITYVGSKADSSLFDIKFGVKDAGMTTVGSFVGNSGFSVDTTISTISQTTSNTFYITGLAVPEADSICFRLQPNSKTQNLACTVDSTVITRIVFKIK